MTKLVTFSVLLFLALLLPAGVQGQATTVSILPGYTHRAYYSLDNGLVKTAPDDGWDLAFQLTGFAAGIRAHHPQGVRVHKVPGFGIADWALVDTAGMTAWPELHNEAARWDLGALNQGIDTANAFDLGWGIYNPITHHVNGDSLFIITLADGAMRKLKIDRLASGVFTFTHAQLDGSDEVEVQLRKSDFPNKHFAYYSFAQDSLLDLDPEADSWDLLFSRYQAELAPGVFYPVTGVRTNFGVEVAEVRGVDVNSLVEADTANYPLSAEIDVIGYDWKSYSPPAQQWTLADSTAFLVAQADGEVHKLVFTGFGGSANGNFEFEQQTLTTGLFDWPALSLSLFPNPATDRVSIRWGAAQVDQIQVLDLAGRALMTQSVSRGDGEMMLSLGDLPRGLYLVRLIGQEGQGIARIHLQ